MNKYIVIVALLSISTFAQAQTTTPQSRAGVMREGVKTQLQNKKPELKMGSSTKMMEKRDLRTGSTTRPLMNKMASSTKNMMSSTTRGMMGERKEEKRELKMTVRKDMALAQKDALIKRLTLALENLTKAKTSIEAYVTKRTAENKPIGDAKMLLETANTKIEAAKKAVAAVLAWKPDVKAASSTEISLEKPRETANVAIKAVHEARKSLHEVIKELRAQIKPIKESENNQ